MAKQTKQLIEQKFVELLSERPLNKIGVREVTEACGINRNTFYYYYKNIPDLIETVVREIVDVIIAEHPPVYGSLEEVFMEAVRFAREQKQLIYNIYDSTNRAVFERYLWKICDYTTGAYIGSLPPSPLPPRPEELAIIHDFLKYEMFGFAIDWINHGMPDNAPEKIRVLSHFIQREIAGEFMANSLHPHVPRPPEL